MSSPRPMAPRSGTTGDLGGKTYAAGAVDAAIHPGLHQRADILVLDGALVLVEAGRINAIGHGLVLQIALAALVADRAIERMVDQQELHHALAGLLHCRRLGSRPSGGSPFGGPGGKSRTPQGASSRSAWARPLISTRHMRQLPATESRSWKQEARDLGARLLARLEQRVFGRDVDFLCRRRWSLVMNAVVLFCFRSHPQVTS